MTTLPLNMPEARARATAFLVETHVQRDLMIYPAALSELLAEKPELTDHNYLETHPVDATHVKVMRSYCNLETLTRNERHYFNGDAITASFRSNQLPYVLLAFTITQNLTTLIATENIDPANREALEDAYERAVVQAVDNNVTSLYLDQKLTGTEKLRAIYRAHEEGVKNLPLPKTELPYRFAQLINKRELDVMEQIYERRKPSTAAPTD